MTALIIADNETALRTLPEAQADLLISCGDLPDEDVIRASYRCRCRHVLAVKGNHDSSSRFPAPILDLHRQTFTFRGVVFGGFAGSWKYKPKGNHLFEQGEVETALALFPRVDVFVAHNSPRMVHDRDDDVHLGFTAFNSYIAREKPRWLLHGHQHVNDECTVGATRVIGTYGFRYLIIPE